MTVQSSIFLSSHSICQVRYKVIDYRIKKNQIKSQRPKELDVGCDDDQSSCDHNRCKRAEMLGKQKRLTCITQKFNNRLVRCIPLCCS